MLIGIAAHPQRAEMVAELASKVYPDVVCTDDGTYSDHLDGCAATHRAVLAALLSRIADIPVGEAEWVVVLEDDALPGEHFLYDLSAALSYAPAPIVGLYLGTGNPAGETQRQIRDAVQAAKEQNRAWITADCLIGSVGYAIKAELLADIIAYIADREEELPLRISRWAQSHGVGICYTQPSLVDHEDGVSIGRPWRGPYYSGRKAWNYGTRDCWCTGSVPLGFCPVWSSPEVK